MPEPELVVFFDIETTGLDPFSSQIITVQVRVQGETKIWAAWDTSEQEIMNSFLEFTNRVYRKNSRLVGYNVLKFDLPMLTQRLSYYNMMSHIVWSRLYKELSWFDLYQFLGDDYGKFREWKAGLTNKSIEITNKDIPRLYQEKEYDKIKEYIEDEIKGIEDVYEALKKEEFYRELMKLRNRFLRKSKIQ